VACINDVVTQGFYKGGFSNPGNTGNSQPDRITGMWRQSLKQYAGSGAMVVPGGLNQGNGLRQRAPVALEYAIRQCFNFLNHAFIPTP
jgi:hypothetical protein